MTQERPSLVLVKGKVSGSLKGQVLPRAVESSRFYLVSRSQNPACRLREESVSNATLLHFAIDEIHVSLSRYLSFIFYKKAEEGVCFLSPNTLR